MLPKSTSTLWKKFLQDFTNMDCKFFKKIEFCGHKISSNGLDKSQKKVDAVVNAPRPENASQICLFAGLVNYQHFLTNLSTFTLDYTSCWKKAANRIGPLSVNKHLLKPRR